MVFTPPNLPHIHLFPPNADSTASELLFPSKKFRVKRPPTDITPPDWVEQIDDYHIASCRWHDNGRFGSCVVVGYHPNDFGMSDRGFVKIWAVEENPHWNLEGTPFPQMKGIWRKIHDDQKTHVVFSYDISEDGRIHGLVMGFPSDGSIRAALYDIGSLYSDWRDFPNAPNWEVAQKLHEARLAVDKMRDETKHKWSERHIDEMRQKISELQNDIAQVEKNLNEMYEKAADGMDLLEEYGIKVDLGKDPDEERKGTEEGVDALFTETDFSILPPPKEDVHLRYSGKATIMRNASGGCLVKMDNHAAPPRIGDFVIDPNNGLSAVYSTAGTWEILDNAYDALCQPGKVV